MLERGARDEPALAALADDPVLRRPGVGEEHLVEVGAARHLAQRPHLDARLLHGNQQVGDAGVLRRLGLRAAQTEHVVGRLRRRRPDLLPVDHPLVADELGAGLERSQVAARARLAVALTPTDLAADRRADELLLLPGLALLEQRGHEHHGADPGDVARRAHLHELLADDRGPDLVGLLLGAAVLLGNRAVQVAQLRGLAAEAARALLPRQLGVGALGRPVAAQERLHLGAEVLVLLAVAEIHGILLRQGWGSRRAQYTRRGRRARARRRRRLSRSGEAL